MNASQDHPEPAAASTEADTSLTSQLRRPVRALLEELGLVTLYHAPADSKILILQRFVRLFAYGGSTLILASYLSELGTSDTRIGLFMTLTLVGDVFISFLLTLIADNLGRRWILVLGAALMSASGIVFGLVGNYWILLAAAILGVISPRYITAQSTPEHYPTVLWVALTIRFYGSGNEIGPFRAIEESTLAHLTNTEHRSDIYAWYSLIGTAGTALGLVCCGWIVTLLKDEKHWTSVRAYRLIFFIYAAVGLVKLCLALLLSKECEVQRQPSTTETAPLLGNNTTATPSKDTTKKRWKLLPNISKESRVILAQLCVLFAFDNFASGLAPV